MQNFGVTSKEHYGMLWYFLERSMVIQFKHIIITIIIVWNKGYGKTTAEK